MTTHRCAVVGGGIIGTAVAREIMNRLPGANVTIFEKEAKLAGHQTGHNSGVVHAGLYYEPGGLKAQLCRRGGALLQEFCAETGVAYEECGKIVVAQNDLELARLKNIFERAVANGVPDVRMLNEDQMREIEPASVGKAALHSPHTAIVDYVGVTKALAADVETAGGRVLCNQRVTGLEQTVTGVKVSTQALTEQFDMVVTCAGLQSDRVSRYAGDARTPRVVPFFGDYLLLKPEKRHLVKGLIYPVPDPKYPFLGVHLTKRIDGEVMVGPNAFLSPGRESYAWAEANMKDFAETLLFPGFWKFASQNISAAARESRTVFSKRRFINEASRYVPGISQGDVLPGGRGVRAQAMRSDGSLVDDFVITDMGRLTHVRNAPSPGATSSMAIAEYIVGRALASAGFLAAPAGIRTN